MECVCVFLCLSSVWLYFSMSLEDIVQKQGLTPALMIFAALSSISLVILVMVSVVGSV